MGLWRNITRLSFSGPVMGVKGEGTGLDVITPAQAVSVVDGLAHWAIAPPAVAHGLVQGLVPPFAGDFSGLEIHVGGQGIWLLRGFPETDAVGESMSIWKDRDQVAVNRIGPLVPFVAGVGDGITSESSFFGVVIDAAERPAIGGPEGRIDWAVESTAHTVFDLYFPPGNRIFLVQAQANRADLASYTWRDVPSVERARA